ncbi:TadE/TadG family type IV pilus assembly protein [Peristeroidobacter soli]|uniref:TadE/TadG family type IV pilus assembly protein n=1 Tax=Peristeroidobacter soli TaxID=2497877 RepID=UPI001300BB22|nr:pilus assembly protein TadG-related protein [Peristeroidobacter soli]
MQPFQSRSAQRGAVAILVAIAMGALLVTAGLALDMGHTFLNKTRLQNAVDAAALAAAKTLDDTGSITLATDEAVDAFRNNAAATGNREVSTAYGNGAGSLRVTVDYSATLPPFATGAPSGPYVRVRATGFVMPAWLVRVGGIFQKTVAAAAVAGPRTLNVGSTVCNVAPMMVCGDPAVPNMWGYTLDAPVVLKKSTPGGQSPVGPGNFQLIQLGGSGAAVVRDNMAGSYDACITGGSTIQTQTGNEAGPVAQGLNTRFGQYNGPMHGTEDTYPPDVIVRAQNPALNAVQSGNTYNVYQNGVQITAQNIAERLYDYQEYLTDLMDPARYDNRPMNDGGTGAFERRVLAVPVGNCTGTTNGQGAVPLLGFACFFLLQPAEQQGNDSFVYGQFINDCSVNGTPGPSPVAGNGPHIIQLYDDPNSTDS